VGGFVLSKSSPWGRIYRHESLRPETFSRENVSGRRPFWGAIRSHVTGGVGSIPAGDYFIYFYFFLSDFFAKHLAVIHEKHVSHFFHTLILCTQKKLYKITSAYGSI